MDRPLAKIDENCDLKNCPHWARETPKKPLYSPLPYYEKNSESSSESSSCTRKVHAAILNFNHAFTSLRRRNPQNLKLIRADFASLWKKRCFLLFFLKESSWFMKFWCVTLPFLRQGYLWKLSYEKMAWYDDFSNLIKLHKSSKSAFSHMSASINTPSTW